MIVCMKVWENTVIVFCKQSRDWMSCGKHRHLCFSFWSSPCVCIYVWFLDTLGEQPIDWTETTGQSTEEGYGYGEYSCCDFSITSGFLFMFQHQNSCTNASNLHYYFNPIWFFRVYDCTGVCGAYTSWMSVHLNTIVKTPHCIICESINGVQLKKWKQSII